MTYRTPQSPFAEFPPASMGCGREGVGFAHPIFTQTTQTVHTPESTDLRGSTGHNCPHWGPVTLQCLLWLFERSQNLTCSTGEQAEGVIAQELGLCRTLWILNDLHIATLHSPATPSDAGSLCPNAAMLPLTSSQWIRESQLLMSNLWLSPCEFASSLT